MLKPLTFKYLFVLHIPLGKVDVVTLTVFSLTQAYSPGVHVTVCLDGSVITEYNCLVGISCPLWVGKAAVENSENWSGAAWDCTEPNNIRFATLGTLISSDLITEKGWDVATSRILGILSSSGMVTDFVECGVDNDGCSDESHEHVCQVVTISGSGDDTIGPEWLESSSNDLGSTHPLWWCAHSICSSVLPNFLWAASCC